MLPLPGLAVKLALGEMGETLLLDSAKVMPTKLEALAYQFTYPNLRDALTAALRRN